MLVVQLMGGMGNQLHIYAMGRSLAMKLGLELALDVSQFQKCKMRQYSLGLWKGVTAPVIAGHNFKIIREQGLPYNPKLLARVKDNTTLLGYWQCEEYHKDIKPILLQEFVPKQPMTERGLKTLDQIRAAGNRSVFLTVRRTDYVGSSFHNVLGMEYYEKALRIIADKTNPVVFVMSDEPEWCRENMKLPYPMVVAGNFDRTTKDHLGREDEELTLMAACSHAVMANSSYSWWGAYLSAADTMGTVVAPKQWFYGSSEDSSTICPARWVRI